MLVRSVLSVCLLSIVTADTRGVNPKQAHLYNKDRFYCFDGTQSFPLSYVNDDYCDCNDGSDEPGTAACANGLFYCQNKGFKGMSISSSRVDDSICDCCDGSDEIHGRCVNNCQELGAHLLEESRRIRKEQAIGYQQRLGYMADGKAAKSKRTEDRKVLEEEATTRNQEMEERRIAKEAAEKPAIEAKEAAKAKFDADEEERKNAANELERVAAETEFSRIDVNNDGDVSTEELLEYGSSEDSLIAYEDIKLMVDSGEIEPASLLQTIQEKIHQENEEQKILESEQKAEKKKKRAKKPKLPDPVEPEVMTDEDGQEMWGEDGKKIIKPATKDEEDFENYEDEDEDEYQDVEDPDEDIAPITNTFTYDPETQKLIDIFEDADELYKSAKSEYDRIKQQLDNLDKLNNLDFGPHEEFSSLYNKCYDYHDEKYNYKLCTFEKSEQNGLSLGKWEGWVNDEDGVNRYNKMKYTRGQSCWNGPDRSTVVEIECGSENRLYSATEPAKCEYNFKFKTPAACTKVQNEHEIHEEL